MFIGKVEGKYTQRQIILFKIIKIWLIVSTILSLICILSMFLELIYYGSGYSLIPFILLSPWLPGAIMIGFFKEMRRVSSVISIYSDRLVFHYNLGFKDMDRTMFWGDVVELIPYDMIRDNRNQVVRFPPLERKDMERIMWTAERIENLDIDQIWQIRNIDEAVSKVLKAPTGQITVSKRSWLFTIQLTFIGLIFAFLLYASANGIVRHLVLGNYEHIVCSLGLLPFTIPIFVISIIGIYRQTRIKEFRVDKDGIRYFYKKSVRFRISWQEMDKVSNNKSSSIRIIIMHLRNGKKKKISSAEFDLQEIRKAFEIMKDFCSYHGVKIDNRLGW